MIVNEYLPISLDGCSRLDAVGWVHFSSLGELDTAGCIDLDALPSTHNGLTGEGTYSLNDGRENDQSCLCSSWNPSRHSKDHPDRDQLSHQD